MYLFFPLALGGLFAHLAMDSERTFRLLHRRKNCQIAVDNSLIRLGELDESLFKRVEAVNQVLHRLHTAYHLAAACALNPATSVKCLAAQRSTRKAIQELQRRTSQWVGFCWKANGLQARAEWARLGISDGRWNRERGAPIAAVECGLCRLPKGWSIGAHEKDTWVGGCFELAAVEGVVRWMRTKTGWKYKFIE